MSDCLLEPRDDVRYCSDVCFGEETVELIPEEKVDAAVVEPTDPHVDLAVVDALEFFVEHATT